MELSLIIAILAFVVSTFIALASLAYAIKQRNVVQKEMSKRRYFESALSNLNEAINSLRSIDSPNILRLNEGYETWGDTYNDSFTLAVEVLRASFELEKKKIPLEVSYRIEHFWERDKPPDSLANHKIRIIENLDKFDARWFIDYFRVNVISVKAKMNIPNFERFWENELNFSLITRGLSQLIESAKSLLSYEEVFESISPDSVRRINQLYEEIAEEIFKTICVSKSLVIDLNKFRETNQLMKYLIEEILNYSYISEKFSKLNELISELADARKELFLKIA